MLDLDTLDWTKNDGVVTVIAQDAITGAVLMVAQADRDALAHTLATGEMHYRSRSRGLWHKGATSGHTQRVLSLAPDCDGDAVLARVIPAGPACHTGSVSCFGPGAGDMLSTLDQRIANRLRASGADASHTTAPTEPLAPERVAPPSYTQRLGRDRNLRLKKLGEETAELVAACADGDQRRIVEEAADLLYHLLVAARVAGVSLNDIRTVLARRADHRPENTSLAPPP